jgi:hypothetical protein
MLVIWQSKVYNEYNKVGIKYRVLFIPKKNKFRIEEKVGGGEWLSYLDEFTTIKDIIEWTQMPVDGREELDA